VCLFSSYSSSNACIMILSKFTFVLLCFPFLSPLLRWWKFSVRIYGFSTRLGNAELAWASLTLFLVRNVTQSVKSSWKRNIDMHCDWATQSLLWLITWGQIKDLVRGVLNLHSGGRWDTFRRGHVCMARHYFTIFSWRLQFFQVKSKETNKKKGLNPLLLALWTIT